MKSALVPLLLVGIVPVVWFAWRLGWLRDRRVRWAVYAGCLLGVGLTLPYEGVDFVYLKRLNLFIAAAAAALVLLRHGADRLGLRRALAPRTYFTALATLAAFSVVVYTNFFSFHGERTFVHYHDVAHYYLGSKYFDELGYDNLYTAMLRAEAEVYENRFKAIQARDLTTDEVVHIRPLLQRSDPVRAAFSAERWEDFKVDVAWFRDALGPQYGTVLTDHGYNPTPFWTLVGGSLATLVPAGSGRGILLLTLLDPLLLLLTFGAVWWAFGRETMLLGVVYVCVLFGATFGWTGGAFGRYFWFFALVTGVCCLERRCYRLAGALVAVATLLRIFPAFFLAGIALHAVHELRGTRRLSAGSRRVLASFALAAVALLALTAAREGGVEPWRDFSGRMSVHTQTVSPNIVGLTNVLAWRGGPESVSAEELAAIRQRRSKIYTIQLLVVAPLALLLVAARSRRENLVGAAVLGIPLLFLTLNLAAYYYVFLLVWILVFRDDPRRIALLFSVEAISYTLLLFEEREGLLFVYRSLLVLFLLGALYLDRRDLSTPLASRAPVEMTRYPKDRAVEPATTTDPDDQPRGVGMTRYPKDRTRE